jgi:hypothetical protein
MLIIPPFYTTVYCNNHTYPFIVVLDRARFIPRGWSQTFHLAVIYFLLHPHPHIYTLHIGFPRVVLFEAFRLLTYLPIQPTPVIPSHPSQCLVLLVCFIDTFPTCCNTTAIWGDSFFRMGSPRVVYSRAPNFANQKMSAFYFFLFFCVVALQR